ncbi:MAG: mannose-1-phosphate guanylyltransferase [Clostridiales bacterium]|nr:mannose-1-phosphate guanylyltransferase [Clostridiales bacterium]
MKTTAVIMAGGKGERFWPKSRSNMPKQFLSLTNDGKTMIRLTAERHLPMVSWEDIYVVTNRDYTSLVAEQLPNLPVENILAEPIARNTAPCVGYAAAIIQRKYGDAVMLVLASDHLIKNTRMYLETMTQASEIAMEGDSLCTVGITPSYPETGYGYIHFEYDERTPRRRGVYMVRRFVEKPDLATAKDYLSSGEYLWNSGIFVWKASSILERVKRLMPDVYKGLLEIAQSQGEYGAEIVLERVYKGFPSVSIDYGVMEKASGVFTIPGSFGWDDVGSWLALPRINKTDENGNIVNGDVITIGTRDSIIVGGNRLIAAVGLEDIVVVETDDALLIARKESAQDIKKVIDNLKICNRRSLV